MWHVSLLKVQKEAFYSIARSAEESPLSNAVEPTRLGEPVLMAVPMILLAIGCVVLSLFALTGLEHPLLVGPAAEVLMRGAFVR